MTDQNSAPNHLSPYSIPPASQTPENAFASAPPAGSVHIKLDYPVTVGSETYSELYMRRWKVADRLRVQKIPGLDDADREILMMSNLCNVPKEVFEGLDGADFIKAQKTLTGFTSTPR